MAAVATARELIPLSRIIAALLFATAVAVFALQNGQAVEIRFFAARASVSLALVILGSLTAGALAVGVAGGARVLRLSRQRSECAERLRRLEAELAAASQRVEPPGAGQRARPPEGQAPAPQ